MVCDYCAHPRPPHKAGCDEFQLDAVPECWFVSAVFLFIFITCPLNKTLPKGADSLQWHERGFGSRKVDLSHCETSQVIPHFLVFGNTGDGIWILTFSFLSFNDLKWDSSLVILKSIQKMGFEYVWSFFLTIFIPTNLI